MDKVTTAGQPAEYLESLLDILACPLDNSVPLSAVLNAAGEIVALKSGDAQYPVVHNVPCLIPGLGEDSRLVLAEYSANCCPSGMRTGLTEYGKTSMTTESMERGVPEASRSTHAKAGPRVPAIP
jgi:uncharacterized protein YbaR (Trm112 family)